MKPSLALLILLLCSCGGTAPGPAVSSPVAVSDGDVVAFHFAPMDPSAVYTANDETRQRIIHAIQANPTGLIPAKSVLAAVPPMTITVGKTQFEFHGSIHWRAADGSHVYWSDSWMEKVLWPAACKGMSGDYQKILAFSERQ